MKAALKMYSVKEVNHGERGSFSVSKHEEGEAEVLGDKVGNWGFNRQNRRRSAVTTNQNRSFKNHSKSLKASKQIPFKIFT